MMILHPDFDRLQKRIETYGDTAIEYQTRLTAIPAIGPENGGEGEVKKNAEIRSILQELNADEIEEIQCPDDRVKDGYRPNLLGYFKGYNSSRKIWIISHMDVVPEGDRNLWDQDPFTVLVDGDKIIGRGVEDDQQGIVSSLLAAKALREEQVLPNYDVVLVMVADEETGSKYGLSCVLKRKLEEFGEQDLIIIPDAGNADGTMIEVAEKTILWLKFTITGKQCHASQPELGINAHRAGAHLIVKLNRLYEQFPEHDELFDPPISTFEPTKKEANVDNVNTIPGTDIFYLDCRILPNVYFNKVISEIKRQIEETETEFGVKISVDLPHSEPSNPATPHDAPVVKALQIAVKAVHGRKAKPMGIGGGTVAACVRGKGFNAAVWCTNKETAHQPNEHSLIPNIIGDAKVFAHVFLQDF